jgi:AraC-like DNA-binding protein
MVLLLGPMTGRRLTSRLASDHKDDGDAPPPEAGAAASAIAPPRRRILALVLGRIDRLRLGDVLRGWADLEVVDNVDTLQRAALRSQDVVDTLIIEPFDTDRIPTAPVISRLRAARPDLGLIGYITRGQAYSPEVLTMARAGVHELIFRGTDDVSNGIRLALARVGAGPAQAAVRRALTDAGVLSTPEGDAIITTCLQYGHAEFSVDDLARFLGVHRKTLATRCRMAGLPTPAALTVWLRLMQAATLLDVPGRRVEDVAEALGYRKGNVLRNALKRYTGRRATELRTAEGGALVQLLAAFLSPDAFGRARVEGEDDDLDEATLETTDDDGPVEPDDD